jgi:Flp pilus assembly protein CpaB
MNRLVLIGVIVAALGLLGLLIPVITTSHTKEVARVGDVSVQAKDRDTLVVPQAAAFGAIAIGVVLIGVGAYRRA